MRTVKKLSALLLSLALLTTCLAGCGGKEEIASPSDVAEGMFDAFIKNDLSKLQTSLGYETEEEAREELLGDTDMVGIMTDATLTQFEQLLGTEVKTEDAQAFAQGIQSALNKLSFSAEVTEMDEKAGTAVVTCTIDTLSPDVMTKAMEAAMTEALTDESLLSDPEALVSAVIQAMAAGMSAAEPSGKTVEFTADFELTTTVVGGKAKKVWLPADEESFGSLISSSAFGTAS